MLALLNKYVFRAVKKNEIKRHELNYLFWECTLRCSLQCLHCGSDCTKDSSLPDMPIDDFLRAVDTIQNPSKDLMVVFTGGEPLMRQDLELCGSALRQRGIRWSMVSNGHLYSLERHISLLNAGMGALTISLDGLRDSHNWLRNNVRSFDTVLGAIELAASSARLNFDVVTCVNQRNIKELGQIRELLLQKNVKAWRLFTIIPIGRAVDNPDLMLTDVQFVALMEFIVESRVSKEIDVKFSCEGYVGSYEFRVRDSGYFCRAGVNIGSVLLDGSISACPNIDRSFAQGSIYDDNFNDVWQNKFAPFRHREWTKKGQCQSCGSYDDCQGNGFHNWHGDMSNVLVCHHAKIENVLHCQSSAE